MRDGGDARAAALARRPLCHGRGCHQGLDDCPHRLRAISGGYGGDARVLGQTMEVLGTHGVQDGSASAFVEQFVGYGLHKSALTAAAHAVLDLTRALLDEEREPAVPKFIGDPDVLNSWALERPTSAPCPPTTSSR